MATTFTIRKVRRKKGRKRNAQKCKHCWFRVKSTRPLPSTLHDSSQDNPAREALTIKCVKVIVENFERLPAHDATGGLNTCSYNDGDRAEEETKDGSGGGDVNSLGADPSAAGQSDPVGVGGAGIGDGDGTEESKLEAGEDGQATQRRQKAREGRVIPAKFLQLISAGLSTDLDPKV